MKKVASDKATMNEARREDETMRNETANKVTMSEETTMKVKELAQKFILDDEAKHNIGQSKGYLMKALIEDDKLRMALIEDESLRKMLLEETKFLISSKDKYTFRMASMEFEEERQLLPKVENMLHATELTTADPKGAVIWSLGIKLIIDNERLDSIQIIKNMDKDIEKVLSCENQSWEWSTGWGDQPGDELCR